MNRRRFLGTIGGGVVGALSGCQFKGPQSTPDTRETPARTSTELPTSTPSPTETATSTDLPGPDERTDLFVAPDGRPDALGTDDDPLDSIQRAFEHAYPGDTIHALPGDYVEAVRTQRSGRADAPITLTGPPDAVFRGNPKPEQHKFGFHIEHSHIHIRGMTFNGLHDPTQPDRADSYVKTLITARHTPSSPEHYHRNLVIKPDAIGNTLRPLIHVMHSEGVEIGEFQLIGPPGLAMGKFGDDTSHNGEIVYLGVAPATIPQEGEGPEALPDMYYHPDTTNDVHVHHIDNSAGYPHAELVDVKAGCHEVLIEYCTDAGGAGSYIEDSRDQDSGAAINLGGREVTVRWNRIAGSAGNGIEIGNWGLVQPEAFAEQNGRPYPAALEDHGRANDIYGNSIRECANLAIRYLLVYSGDGGPHIAEAYGPDDQARVCDNDISGDTHGTPESECQTNLPTTETIGHLGGNSPWTE